MKDQAKFEKVKKFLTDLISHATDGSISPESYESQREGLIEDEKIRRRLPDFVLSSRTIEAFWGHIKKQSKTWQERRDYLNAAFDQLLNYLEFGDDQSETDPVQVLDVSTFAERSLRVFISYSTLDKDIAGGIKRGLSLLGMDVFLAHEDIVPSSQWTATIEENLDSTDIFLPLITKNFKQSDWTDQESGIAFAKRKVILPLSVEGNQPYGFLGRYQSAKINIEATYLIPCDAIIAALIREHSDRLGVAILRALIRAFIVSETYDQSGQLAKLLSMYGNLDEDDVRLIFAAALANNQIYQSRTARPHLEDMFKKFRGKLDVSMIDDLSKRMGDEFK